MIKKKKRWIEGEEISFKKCISMDTDNSVNSVVKAMEREDVLCGDMGEGGRKWGHL